MREIGYRMLSPLTQSMDGIGSTTTHATTSDALTNMTGLSWPTFSTTNVMMDDMGMATTASSDVQPNANMNGWGWPPHSPPRPMDSPNGFPNGSP